MSQKIKPYIYHECGKVAQTFGWTILLRSEQSHTYTNFMLNEFHCQKQTMPSAPVVARYREEPNADGENCGHTDKEISLKPTWIDKSVFAPFGTLKSLRSIHKCKRLTRTCIEVMEAVCPCKTATGAQVRRHHTRMILSQLAEARSVFSKFTVMSEISAEWPRRVARRRPSSVAQIFIRQSSEPLEKSTKPDYNLLQTPKQKC